MMSDEYNDVDNEDTDHLSWMIDVGCLMMDGDG